MTEKFPIRPEEPQKPTFEQLVLLEMEKLRKERDETLHSKDTSKMMGGMHLPPMSEQGLRKMAERNVSAMLREKKRQEAIKREQKYIQAEGLTEEELEKIAKERLEKKGN